MGLVGNHPFIGGNKRTGFGVGILFLELNGSTFTASEADAAHVILELAAGTLDKRGYVKFLRANSQDAAARYFALPAPRHRNTPVENCSFRV